MPASRLQQAEVAKRRAEVLRARAAGMSFQQIAQTVPGVGNATLAAQDHARALKGARELRAAAGEDVQGAVELELIRLEQATLAVQGVLQEAAADPATHDRVLRAASQLARLSESRTQLLGLGQPGRVPAGPAGEDELTRRRRNVRARRQNLG